MRLKFIKFEIIKNKKNFGPGKCRNIAWSQVDTEYIAFIDSDDIWSRNKLKKQMNIFENFNVDLVFTAKNNLLTQKAGIVFKNVI